MNTLDYYNKNSEEYFNSTLNVDMTNTYKEFLKLVPEGGKILDLGCGSGRDSMNFMKLGYEVTAVDGSKELAKKASVLLGKEVIVNTFEELELKEKFHGIWACASLLHIKREDLKIPASYKNRKRECGCRAGCPHRRSEGPARRR